MLGRREGIRASRQETAGGLTALLFCVDPSICHWYQKNYRPECTSDSSWSSRWVSHNAVPLSLWLYRELEYLGYCECTLQLHLAKLIPRRFLKPAVFKYPTTVNNPEIYILLPKPCPWMWHLMCGNRVRNGSDRKPETGKTCSLKPALFKNPIGAAL